MAWVVALGLDRGLALAEELGLVSAQDLELVSALDLGLVLALEVETDPGSCVRSQPAVSPENRTSVLLPELRAQNFVCPANPQSRTWNRSEGKLHQTAMSESNHRTRLES